MHLRFRKGKVVDGTVKLEYKTGGKDNLLKLPWDHIYINTINLVEE